MGTSAALSKSSPSRATDKARGTAVARAAKSTTSKALAALVDPDKPLTEKQKLFVKFWASGESITSASYKAGYEDGASYAYRMVRMPNILMLYEAEKAAYEAASMMSKKRVIDMQLEAFDMAKMAAEPASMVSAAREIGKLCGYYEPVKTNINVTVSGHVVHERIARLSDAELLKIIDDQPQIPLAERVDGDEIADGDEE